MSNCKLNITFPVVFFSVVKVSYTFPCHAYIYIISFYYADLAELKWTDAETNAVFAYLCCLGDPADFAFVLGKIAGTAEWTFLYWFPSVDKIHKRKRKIFIKHSSNSDMVFKERRLSPRGDGGREGRGGVEH